VHPGLNWGVDFAGGIVVEARTQAAADFGVLRDNPGHLGLGPVQVQQLGVPRTSSCASSNRRQGSSNQRWTR
jgi:SecD/SecF fusion protein